MATDTEFTNTDTAALAGSAFPTLALVPGAAVIPLQTETDAKLIEMWLHGRGEHTRRAYESDIARLLAFVCKPVRSLTIGDVQAFADSLLDLAPSSRGRVLSSVKSLLTFAQRVGYVPFNVGAALRLPRFKGQRAARILTEESVLKMLALETTPRNHALLRFAYSSGARVEEIARLTWADLQPREDLGQAVLYGKGDKTRVVLISAATLGELAALRGSADPRASVFVARDGTALKVRQIRNVVKAAGKRAGLPDTVSPHWLRHAAASHALDRGASLATVRDTLGHASASTTSLYLHARPRDGIAKYLAV